MSENVLLGKSYQFALRSVRLYRYLCEEKKEFVLSRKAMETGTSVGAKVKSAQEAGAKAAFVNEMSLALQRASETQYWLQLLHDGGYLSEPEFTAIHEDCVEIIRLLVAIVKKSRGTL